MTLKLEMRSHNIDWYCRHNRFPDFHLTAFPWCGLTEDIEAWKTLVFSMVTQVHHHFKQYTHSIDIAEVVKRIFLQEVDSGII